MKPSRKTKRGVLLEPDPEPAQIVPARTLPEIPAWLAYAFGILAAFVCAFAVYSPALEGPFVFDDLNMPFTASDARSIPIRLWWGVRPFLGTTYWANLHLTHSSSTFSYHAVNVALHATAAVLLFFVLLRILEWAQTSEPTLLSLFGSAIFLLHPIQTEAVSYIAQRGEDLGACLYFLAFCIFLYRKPGPISWPRSLVIAAIYPVAVVTKEHTATLPALLLLTDYFFNPGFSFQGVKRNWRLYSLIAIGMLMGVAVAVKLLSGDTSSVGFSLKEFTPAQYLFTEFRVFFAYLGLFVYPLWQTIDYDYSISRTILDHGSLFYLAALVLLVTAAFRYRRRFPLAAYGFLVFCILLIPTSSIIPIRDPIADRRLYLPIIGLVLILIEAARNWHSNRYVRIAILTGFCLLLGALSYVRNEKWSTPVALWADAAVKNPDKARVQFGLATSLFRAQQCHDAVEHFQKAIALSPPDYQLNMDLGLAQQCDNRLVDAVNTLKRSIEIKPSAEAWASLGLVQARQGNLSAALAALDSAEKIRSNYIQIFIYRGGILNAAGRPQDALEQFKHALLIQPDNPTAKDAVKQLTAPNVK